MALEPQQADPRRTEPAPDTSDVPPMPDLDTPVDFSKGFVPEEVTPLYHTDLYDQLTTDQKLTYNQLSGLYINEQTAFFEEQLVAVLRSLLKGGRVRGTSLEESMRRFLADELEHTTMFRSLNHLVSPEGNFDQPKTYHYVQASPASLMVLSFFARFPRRLTFWLWLIMILEERSIYISKLFVKQATDLEPHFVATHLRHVTDEVNHVRWDIEMIEVFWAGASKFHRAANAKLLSHVLLEYFTLPKRSGVRIVRELQRRHPELAEVDFLSAFQGLSQCPAYYQVLYSAKTIPRTLALMESLPEFKTLHRRIHQLCTSA